MSTHSVKPQARSDRHVVLRVSPHVVWLGAGFLMAFALPYVFTDLLDIHRDVFYGVYAASVAFFVGAWSRSTGYDLRAAVRRHWPWAVGLGVAFGALMALIVVRSEDATARPDNVALIGALGWRGVVYGATDGLLLSAFPILAVFAAFSGRALGSRASGKIAIGAAALAASLAMTAVYHVGYSDFRSEKVRKPLVGDAMWSVPTLVTLNPIGAPIAHVGLHVTAVLHSYETDTFLPPHE